MQFCSQCEGLLIPKRNTDELYCRICDKSIKIKGKADYKMQKLTNNTHQKVRSKTAVIEQRTRSKSISEEERRAFEDYFTSGD